MRYEAPSSLDQAVALLAKESGDARILAGGTDLLVQMRTDILDPVLIIDIKGIAETRQIKEEAGGFRVGAAVTGAELKEHAKLKSVWPGVVEAANLIGSTQVQGRATMGGNLCNGSPAADSVPALIAAGAKATIVGPKGRRDVAVGGCHARPAQAVLDEGRDHRLVPAAGQARPHGRCLPALHPAHRDGHRRGRLRRLPHARCRRQVHGGARVARRRGGASAAGGAGCRCAGRHEASTTRRCRSSTRRRARPASPIDDKRGTKEYRIKVAGVLARRTALIALERARKA